MTYVNPKELTLSEEQIHHFAELVLIEDLAFQSRLNRDTVYFECKRNGVKLKRSMMANQSIDPRYTVEGSHLPDKGLGNDRIFVTLYQLEYTA